MPDLIDKASEISGVEFEYYFVCKTQLWLFSHGLIKSDEDENVKIGRIIHREKYKREKRERSLNRIKFDVMKLGNEYVVYETKKEKVLDAHIWQVKYYLYQLSKLVNLPVKGILTAPKFRKVITLSNDDIKFIEQTLEEIKNVKQLRDPPAPIKQIRCKKCAYRTFCFGDEYE